MRTPFRSLLSLDRKFYGAYVRSPEGMIVEAMKYAGVDFIMYELEHDQSTLAGLQNIIRACDAVGMACMVRVPEVDRVTILKALDMGASAIKCCDIASAEEARKLVACCKYPPEGIRSACSFVRSQHYGERNSSYYPQANAEVVVSAVIEGLDGLNNMEEIIATPGLDTVSVGLGDVSAVLGLPPEHPDIQKYVTECIALCEKYGKQCSAQGRSREYLEQFRDVKCVSHYHIKAPEIVLYTGYKKLLESLR